MIQVIGTFQDRGGLTVQKICQNGREYEIKKLGYHHSYRRGRTLIHVFSVVSDTMFFRLELDTESLNLEIVDTAENV
jgi:hypothetical protein